MQLKLGQWIGLVALLISLYILWQIRHVLLLGFTAIVLATALNRGVRQLQRLGIQRRLAVFLSVAIVFALLALLIWLIGEPFSREFQQLMQRAPEGIERLRSWSNWLQNLIPQQLGNKESGAGLTEQLQGFANHSFGRIFTFLSRSVAVPLEGLLVLILTVMLLADPLPYRRAFVRLFPSFYRRRADEILSCCDIALGGWLIGILFNVSVITVVSWVGLWILQVPLVLANALLAGLLTFIPNIGPTLSVIPPMAIALLDAPWKAWGVLILYILIHEIEADILTPLVMAKQVSLLPAITLLSQLAFTVFFGLLGLLLAIPLLVVLQVWLQECLIKDVLDQWQKETPTPAQNAASTPLE
jgi:predicted PurR-regulated permease PerM